MKRITSAALAAITALSLSTTAAFAQNGDDESSSSEITNSSKTETNDGEEAPSSSSSENDGEGAGESELSPGHGLSVEAISGSSESSSEENQESLADLRESIFGSSYDNDEEQEWAKGSSADVLIGILLAIGAAFAAISGLIPGLSF